MSSPFSNHDALEERRTGFEEGYFRDKDARLVAKLKTVFDAKHTKEELRKATGVTDEAALDRLVTVIDRKELLTAFKLYPLVEIAWADGKVEPKEAEAVERIAVEAGVPRDSPAFDRLRDWIRNGPTQNARSGGKLYASQLRKTLSAEELHTFREDLLKFANRVAEAAGGFFGIFGNTSAAEQAIIEEIQKALSVE